MHLPLKIVWPGISVVSIRTERTDVARGFMNEAVPDHLVLALETFAALATGTAGDWAIMWPCG